MVLGDAVSKLETFVRILSHISLFSLARHPATGKFDGDQLRQYSFSVHNISIETHY